MSSDDELNLFSLATLRSAYAAHDAGGLRVRCTREKYHQQLVRRGYVEVVPTQGGQAVLKLTEKALDPLIRDGAEVAYQLQAEDAFGKTTGVMRWKS